LTKKVLSSQESEFSWVFCTTGEPVLREGYPSAGNWWTRRTDEFWTQAPTDYIL